VRIDNLSHAILFSSEEGSGALPQALSLAGYILCSDKKEDGSACGTCPSCRKTKNAVHPDLHFIVPVNRSAGISAARQPVTDDFLDLWRSSYLENPDITEQEWYKKLEIENKQGAISAAEAGNILRKLQFRSFEGGARVIIIWLPERMHPAAANKLLKILEEPVPGTYFLLVSHRPDQLLPTIRSRCMLIQVPPKEYRPLPRETYTNLERLLDLFFQESLRVSWTGPKTWPRRGESPKKRSWLPPCRSSGNITCCHWACHRCLSWTHPPSLLPRGMQPGCLKLFSG